MRTLLRCAAVPLVIALFPAGLLCAEPADERSEGRTDELIAKLESADPAVQLQAATALGKLGRKAEPAIPALIQAMEQDRFTTDGDSVGAAACAALGKIGRGGVGKLNEALDHNHPQVRRGAALALHDIGKDAAPAVPKLIEVLKQDDPATRHPVIYALAAIGPEAKPAVPLLIVMLSHEDQQSRWEACRALGAIGPEAKPAVPELLDLLSEGVASSRANAAAALGKIGPEIGEDAIERLGMALQDRQGAVREQAAIALGNVGPAAKPALPQLNRALGAAQFEARIPIAKAIWQISGDADRIVPMLVKELPTIESGLYAAEALGEMGPAGKAAVPELIETLKHRDYETRAAAAWALGRIGREAAPAEPELRKLLEDPEEDVRKAAREALQNLAETPAEKPR